MDHKNKNTWYGTTIICIRDESGVVIAGDGQVSLGNTVIKGTARKVRKINNDSILVGFAGATADAFTLLERLEAKLIAYPNQLSRACVELAKDWRTDKYLRKLEAMLAVADINNSYIITGNGDVLEPEDGIIAIGSGGHFALSASRALIDRKDMNLVEKAKKAMLIASEICVYTNNNIIVESL